MDSSRLVVDLRARTFEIEVPHDKVDAILDRLEAFFAMTVPAEQAQPPSTSTRDASEAADQHTDDSGSVDKPEGPKKRARGSGKPKSYQPLDLGLSSEQRESFRADFAEKNPVQQSDLVAVVGYLLKKLTGRGSFSVDEIHSGIKIVSKPTPKNLLAVFGNMKRDGIADYVDSKVVVNSLTEDHVDHHMAKKAAKKK